jgi:hypothetical protein
VRFLNFFTQFPEKTFVDLDFCEVSQLLYKISGENVCRSGFMWGFLNLFTQFLGKTFVDWDFCEVSQLYTNSGENFCRSGFL